MIEKFFLAFIPVFVAIDPIGLVAIFLGLGPSASREQRKRQALLGIFTALGIAIGFIFLGKIIFAALGITVADFQVAGGLILLGLAGRELLSSGSQDRGSGDEFGIVPLECR
jgi:multiple antibiotic resistance protein